MKNIIKVYIALTLIALLMSCGHSHDTTDGHDHHDHHGEEAGHEHHHDEGIHMTPDQIETVGLEFGEMSTIKVSDFVNANGFLGVPPTGLTIISSRTSGIIKGARKLVEGDRINRGTIVGYVENPELLDMQQNYIEAQTALKFKRLELDRQKTLIGQNAGVERNLQSIQAEVELLSVKMSGLRRQLEYVGVNPANINSETIVSRVPVRAPMSGYLSSVSLHNGMYVTPTTAIAEIISTKQIHLELDVLEKDISKVKVDQKITYVVPAVGDKRYTAEVEVIGKEYDASSKTVRVHGHVVGAHPPFTKDMFIRAQLWLSESEETGLPEDAIILDGGDSYVYAGGLNLDEGEYEFEKLRVVTGPSRDGFVSIKLVDPIPNGQKIVTKGAYYVDAQSKMGELSHEH